MSLHYPPELARADRLLSAEELSAKYNPEGEHPSYSRASWRECVAVRGTLSDYWSWVVEQIELLED